MIDHRAGAGRPGAFRVRRPSSAPGQARRRFWNRGRVARLALLVILAAGIAAEVRRRQRWPDLEALDSGPRVVGATLRDPEGRTHTPREWRSRRAVVLAALALDDPDAAGSLRRLAHEFPPRDVAVYAVVPDPAVSPTVARSLARAVGPGVTVLLDPCQELTGQAGLRVTPEAVVVDGDGRLFYRGEASEALRSAIETALAGTPPALVERPARGRLLPEPRPLIDPGAEVTWSRDVAPIVWEHCAPCHRPGEVAPFSLLTYRDAAKRAGFLVEVAQSGQMPPWKAVAGHGDFLDQQPLAPRDLATLARWADLGAPEGDPAERPAPPRFVEGWGLGQPDLILDMPEPFPIPAGLDDIYQAFLLPLPADRDLAISAVEFRPGNRRTDHHARVFVDETGVLRRRDAAQPGPGFTSVGGGDIGRPSVGEWIPGMTPRRLPEGVGKVVRAGSDLVLLVHYHGTGKPEVDRSRVGLYLCKTPPTRTPASIPLSTRDIDIPPGEARHRVAIRAVVPADAHAYSVLPHGHYLLREMRLTALLPDGRLRSLLLIDDWDFNWQGQYHYADPVALPAGTILEAVAYYDNSAGNPYNPHSPPRRVRFGPNSTDEMFGCHVQVLADDPDGDETFRRRWPEGL